MFLKGRHLDCALIIRQMIVRRETFYSVIHNLFPSIVLYCSSDYDLPNSTMSHHPPSPASAALIHRKQRLSPWLLAPPATPRNAKIKRIPTKRTRTLVGARKPLE